MKTSFFFVFCTLSVFAQVEPKVIIFYEYTADGYALYAANDEEYPVTIQFDFDLLNLKVARNGSSAIVVRAEANKQKLLDLMAINVLKGYSFEYTHTVKKGAVKANLKDIIAVSDRVTLKAKEFSKNVDTTDEPVVSSANRNPRDLRESRIAKNTSSRPKPIAFAEPVATTKLTETKLDIKPIVKSESTQVAIAKAVKKKEREKKKREKKKRARKNPVAVTKTKPSKTVVTSKMVEEKVPVAKTVTPIATEKPIVVVIKPDPVVIKPRVENTSVQVATAEPVKKKRAKKTPVVVVNTEPTKTVAASTTIEAKDTAKKTVIPIVTAEPIKKKRTRKKRTKKKPVVVATKSIVISKPIEVTKSVAVTKTETVKPAVTVATPIKRPVIDIVESKKDKKTKIEYAITGKYDAAFQYHLPYSRGATFTISQGYQGAVSHQGKFALDFRMPSGTAIYSAREGTVFKVVENNSQSYASQDCAKYDNYIIINHPDGSFAKYAHIGKDRASVVKGDVISVGQLIGYTGNTGWTGIPALHFEVFVQKEQEQKTIKTNFLTGDGSDYGILGEQRQYRKEY